MKKEIIDTSSLAHTKWNWKYHIVFAPKYRRKVLSSILDHAQASTTLNLYAHALPDHKKISMEKMGVFYG